MTTQPPPPCTRARRPGVVAIVLGGMMLISAWPLILAQVHRGRMASDQMRYHEVVVRVLARSWPEVIYRDYLSATTPGYHTFIAGASKVVGEDRVHLQLLGSIFAIVFVAGMGYAVGRRAPPLEAIALTLPLATSIYVWPSAVWLLPDAAGWLGVLIVLLLSLHGRFTLRTYAAAGLALLGLVFVRQVHIWCAAVFWTSAWLGPPAGDEQVQGERFTSTIRAFAREMREIFSRPSSRLVRTGLALLASLPAFTLLGYFIHLWGGLTPPHFAEAGVGQVAHGGWNPATPAYVLAVFALFAPFFIGFIWHALCELWAHHPLGLFLAGVLGFVVSVVPPTTYDRLEGRWSGVLWTLVEMTPSVGGHISPLLVTMATAGAMLVLAFCYAMPRRPRWILLAALVAYTAAQSANHQAWQRYVEPMVLMWLILASVRVEAIARARRVARILPPIVLSLIFIMLSVLAIARSKPFPVDEYDRRVLPLIESGHDDAAKEALDEIRRMFQNGTPSSSLVRPQITDEHAMGADAGIDRPQSHERP